MLLNELFGELVVNNIDFNGDVELTENSIIWKAKFIAPELLEDEEELVVLDELVEEFEDDLDYIYDVVLDQYDEWDDEVETEEFEFNEEEGVLSVEFKIIEVEDEF